jgi:hypothetical protein
MITRATRLISFQINQVCIESHIFQFLQDKLDQIQNDCIGIEKITHPFKLHFEEKACSRSSQISYELSVNSILKAPKLMMDNPI